MVPTHQALARAFALAASAADEYEWRIAAHALYYAFFHYAGEALEGKTTDRDWRFYWNEIPSDGPSPRKTHRLLQMGWERYRNDYTDANDGRRVRRRLRAAHGIRADADYYFDIDFTRSQLDRLVIIVRRLITVIDES